MNLAETTVINAIRHSMDKNRFANIILAGPIAAGKREMAQMVSRWLYFQNFENTVSIFSQDDYLKDDSLLPNNRFGVKDIDSNGAYDVKAYLNNARKIITYEKERERFFRGESNVYTEGKVSQIYGISAQPKVNIFTGPHVLSFYVWGGMEIPGAISIFMNADLDKCLQNRFKKGVNFPSTTPGSEEYMEYRNYVFSQNDDFICNQKQFADIVIKV